NGIASRYLQPAPHCAVHLVTAVNGRQYPVVRVPSHGEAPICAKRDGPHDSRGRPVGIKAGTHYLRTAGPMSSPIESPEMWREVIRRCVLSERSGLLSSIGQLFDRTQISETTSDEILTWTENALARWVRQLPGTWTVSTKEN